jgi:hypothetical protein
LEYVLDKLVLARQGQVDQQFWHDMIHHQVWQGCDRTYHDINGWINAFFPLRSDLTFNRLCSCDAAFGQTGMDASDFTTGMSSVDIVVDNQAFELNSLLSALWSTTTTWWPSLGGMSAKQKMVIATTSQVQH